jgi:hypothetical protein
LRKVFDPHKFFFSRWDDTDHDDAWKFRTAFGSFQGADTLGLGWVWTVGVGGLLSIAESAGFAV